MILEQITIAPDRNFAYLLADERTREAAIVDPGAEPELVLRRAALLGLQIRFVLNTHGHRDHSGGNLVVQQHTGAKLAAFAGGDVPLQDGDQLHLGELAIVTLHTPGHTLDSVCFLAATDIFTGDTLFVGKVGGTSDRESALLEYRALKEKICALPPETRIWPGHDYGIRPSSTVGDELRTNPFLLCPDFASFLDLKNNWAEYKRVHGIA
jgi:hydroxyacylglutathione hydrolase